jgi:hypothetical protein
MKPNKKFELTVRDIEVIESALRAKAGRRGMAIAQGDVSTQLHNEMTEIQELLQRYKYIYNTEIVICQPPGTNSFGVYQFF